jgi:hypothetical protein
MSADTTGLSRFAWRTEGSASLYVAASPELVYDRVADVTRVGECSLEARGAQWLRGSSPGGVGGRFRGRNRKGLIRWTRTCEVLEADRGRRFVFRTVPCRIDVSRRDSTVWAYSMQPDGDGTMLTHDYRIVRDALPGLKQLYALLMPHHRDMRPHLEHTLRAVKDELERAPLGTRR